MTMCSFATNNFSAEMLRFITAQAGQILPRPVIQFEHTRQPLPPQVQGACQAAGSSPPPCATGGQSFEAQA